MALANTTYGSTSSDSQIARQGKQPSPADVSEVEREMTQLRQAIERLEGIKNDLWRRLSPVLSETDADRADGCEPGCASQLGRELQSLRCSLERVSSQLADLTPALCI